METNIEVRSELRFERGDNYRGPGVLLGVILTYETDRARRAAAEVRSGEARKSLRGVSFPCSSKPFLLCARSGRHFLEAVALVGVALVCSGNRRDLRAIETTPNGDNDYVGATARGARPGR